MRLHPWLLMWLSWELCLLMIRLHALSRCLLGLCSSSIILRLLLWVCLLLWLLIWLLWLLLLRRLRLSLLGRCSRSDRSCWSKMRERCVAALTICALLWLLGTDGNRRRDRGRGWGRGRPDHVLMILDSWRHGVLPCCTRLLRLWEDWRSRLRWSRLLGRRLLILRH